jgi:trk system potassium uptake protein TrkH
MASVLVASRRLTAARLRLNPAQTILLGFAAVILAGGVLLSLPIAAENGQPTPFLTAVFTANSATTVTALTVVDTADHYSLFGEIVIMLLIQLGGFGYMTSWALLAMLLGWRIGLRERVILTESHNLYQLGGVVRFTQRLIVMALSIEAIGAVILALRWMREMPVERAIYLGVFHSISAFNNAGLNLMGGFRSLTGYVADPVISLTIAALVVVGGLGFTVLFDLRSRRLTLHSRTVLLSTGALILGSALLIWLLEYDNAETLGRLSTPVQALAALFQAVTPRTGGFSTVPTAAMSHSTLLLLMALMFIGASPGGTGGGIKTTTFVAPLAVIWSTIRGVNDPVLFRRRLPVFVIYKALTVALISVAFIVTMTVLLIEVDGRGFLPSLFEVTSAFGTVGLTTGITPDLSAWGRIIVMATMFSGRVGLLTIAYGLARQQRPARVRYPEERVYLG